MAELLIKNGANVNVQDESENTPLHYAAANGKKDLVKLLIDHGANANLSNVREQKPIDYANIKGYNEIVSIILGTTGMDSKSENLKSTAEIQTNFSSQNSLSKEDIKTKLKELKELFEEELITEEEFNLKKKELLNQL